MGWRSVCKGPERLLLVDLHLPVKSKAPLANDGRSNKPYGGLINRAGESRTVEKEAESRGRFHVQGGPLTCGSTVLARIILCRPLFYDLLVG
jgi:hypothetical protein